MSRNQFTVIPLAARNSLNIFNLLELLKPRKYTFHIIIDVLFNIIQHGLIYEKTNEPCFKDQKGEKKQSITKMHV